MRKIVFFDIDGTLLDENKNLPPKTKEAVQKLRESGVYVAIATGRAPFMFEDLRKLLGINTYVAFNGQYVVFENRLVYANPLDKEELAKLLSKSRKKGHPLVFMDEKTMKSTVSYNHFIKDSLASLHFPHPEKDESYYLRRDIYQTLLFCEEAEEEYYYAFKNFRFVRWHPYSVDILPHGGSKAEGIKKLINKLGFQMEDVYAFGDGLNDMEMLGEVGTGVAMGNAPDAVKKKAVYVTKSVSDNGIWHGLKELKLI